MSSPLNTMADALPSLPPRTVGVRMQPKARYAWRHQWMKTTFVVPE
jgi:hypothetical protein